MHTTTAAAAAAAAAAAGAAAAEGQQQQQQQQQREVVDGAGVVGSSAGPLFGSGNTRGEEIAFALVMVGVRSTIIYNVKLVSFHDEGRNS